MSFTKEKDFEDALVNMLHMEAGWKDPLLTYPTEKDLLDNWAGILFRNNCGIDRLNNCPLTDTEMQQIMEQIRNLRTPLKLNGFINGKSVAIKRDNPDDKLHFGKEVSLKIYDRLEIAAGESTYQIVRQPRYSAKTDIANDRRGDLVLLINGMPVIHIELKRSGIPISQATNQIAKYAKEGVFTGLFSLVQVFVAMTPEETVYFANPGPDGKFNSNYFFHWADYNNVHINRWQDIARSLLSIPKAHELIGFYTVADGADGVLKVMRPYQIAAAEKISDAVSKYKWEVLPDKVNQLGGYVWHTTGSGKTMTSFKSAQLIAVSKTADKVVFLMDRIELGTQSLEEYRNFAAENESVQATENSKVLIAKLKSKDPADTLIVTSIQKMSIVAKECEERDRDIIQNKRIVFIIDEAHRSTFGDMLTDIKDAFLRAIFFGFTGTPIYDENEKKMNTTASVFGNELHRYTIADGLNDKNVLGFDPCMIMVYTDRDMRRVVALEKAKATTEQEAIADPQKSKIYYKYMNDVPMAGYLDGAGDYHSGIEDNFPNAQYKNDVYTKEVVNDVANNWDRLTHNSMFHAIFATSSIAEAINYYRLFKGTAPHLKVAALFDPNIDNNDGFDIKADALNEIILDYNAQYNQHFSIPTYALMKKDISARLAHKYPYTRIEREPDKQINLLIVVDQMLTGFDSKWISTLFLDKVLQYENIIQAFSRTNRIFGDAKPFGSIRYYRRPHTMRRNIDDAVKLYSGDKPYALFVQKLPDNIRAMNHVFAEITMLFKYAGKPDFMSLPDDKPARRKFAKLFNKLTELLEAARVQSFTWEDPSSKDEATGEIVTLDFDEHTYYILQQRYKELGRGGRGETDDGEAYDLKSHITEMDTGRIDADYMNSRFDKYMKVINLKGASAKDIEDAETELHRTFATLSQEEQKYANLFLHDIQSGDVNVEPGKTFRDYIVEYMAEAKNDQIHRFADTLGVGEKLLRDLMALHPTQKNINNFGRYDAIRSTIDLAKAKVYFESVEGVSLIPPKVAAKADNLLRKFILDGGFDIETTKR